MIVFLRDQTGLEFGQPIRQLGQDHSDVTGAGGRGSNQVGIFHHRLVDFDQLAFHQRPETKLCDYERFFQEGKEERH